MDALEVDFLQPLEAVTDLGALADPWGDEQIDFDEQTGADWYQTMLAASLGGKVVHGANIVPACELLAKTTEDFAERYVHGRVAFEPATYDNADVEKDPIDAKYFGTDYHGSTTLAGEMLAYDTGLWEPSARTRAKNAAILAADMAACTGKANEAIEIVSAITASTVPPEAVTNTAVVLSVTKRAAAVVSKPNHKLFPMASLQRAIRWDDVSLRSDKLPDGAAVDWAKVTLVARYLGEANCAYDANFRAYAKAHGVPYALIMNAWAWISPTDVIIPIDPKKPLPAVPPDIAPSITAALLNHTDSILTTINATIRALADDTTDDKLKALLKIAEAFRQKSRVVKRIAGVGSENIAEIKSHSKTPYSAKTAVRSADTAYNALTATISAFLKKDKTALAVVQGIVTDGVKVRNSELQKAASMLLKNVVWKTAADSLALELGEISTAITRLSRLKRSFGRFSTPWEIEGKFSVDASNRGIFMSLFKSSLLATPKFAPINIERLTEAQHVSVRVVQAVANKVHTHLTEYRNAWKERYEAWAAAWASRKHINKEALANSVKYAGAAIAFKTVTTTGLLSPQTGYVDLATRDDCYLARMMKNYTRKRRKAAVRVKDKIVLSMEDLAAYYDEKLAPEVPFADVEKFARERLKMLADDLQSGAQSPNVAGGSEPSPEEVKLEAEVPLDNDEVEIDWNAPEYAFMYNNDEPLFKITEQTVRATYESSEMAEAHAKANGFASFHEAYEKLKDKARFDDYTDYTRTGLAATGLALPDDDGDAIV
jgi:hypothetical protein